MKAKKLYSQHDYLDAYAIHTDRRIEDDPHLAIGGMREEIGHLQFDFLVAQSMQPEHSLLDIGCGTFRGGKLFVPYLLENNYCGMDISPSAIEYCNEMIEADPELNGKNPEILYNIDESLNFNSMERKFDYIIAQSVINHLPPSEVQICFENIHKVMKENSKFFMTYMERRSGCRKISHKDWQYGLEFLNDMMPEYLHSEQVAYDHPRGMKMLLITKD